MLRRKRQRIKALCLSFASLSLIEPSRIQVFEMQCESSNDTIPELSISQLQGYDHLKQKPGFSVWKRQAKTWHDEWNSKANSNQKSKSDSLAQKLERSLSVKDLVESKSMLPLPKRLWGSSNDVVTQVLLDKDDWLKVKPQLAARVVLEGRRRAPQLNEVKIDAPDGTEELIKKYREKPQLTNEDLDSTFDAINEINTPKTEPEAKEEEVERIRGVLNSIYDVEPILSEDGIRTFVQKLKAIERDNFIAKCSEKMKDLASTRKRTILSFLKSDHYQRFPEVKKSIEEWEDLSHDEQCKRLSTLFSVTQVPRKEDLLQKHLLIPLSKKYFGCPLDVVAHVVKDENLRKKLDPKYALKIATELYRRLIWEGCKTKADMQKKRATKGVYNGILKRIYTLFPNIKSKATYRALFLQYRTRVGGWGDDEISSFQAACKQINAPQLKKVRDDFASWFTLIPYDVEPLLTKKGNLLYHVFKSRLPDTKLKADIARLINPSTEPCELGIAVYRIPNTTFWHTALVVTDPSNKEGVEFTFEKGGGISVRQRYIHNKELMASKFYIFKKYIPARKLNVPTSNVTDFIVKLSQNAYNSEKYHVVKKNCNCFCLEVLERFGLGTKFPWWIDVYARAARKALGVFQRKKKTVL